MPQEEKSDFLLPDREGGKPQEKQRLQNLFRNCHESVLQDGDRKESYPQSQQELGYQKN